MKQAEYSLSSFSNLLQELRMSVFIHFLSKTENSMKYLILSSAIFLVSLLLCVNSSFGATITVDCASGGDYMKIMDGINAAVDGDTVLVAPCVYSGSGNFNMDLQGKDLVIMSSDGPEVTIIDLLDQNTAFFFAHGEDSSTVLDGFTIKNGFSSGSGGAILMWSNSSPTISNCVIKDCEAVFNGGGISLDTGASPTITNCTITGNTANEGGGINVDSASPTITNCTITGNMADIGVGGGIYISYGSPGINNCTIEGNTAADDGGGIYVVNGSPDINHCTISENLADNGGGIYISTFVLAGDGPRISQCTFFDNEALLKGGGIYHDVEVTYGTTFIWSCRFIENNARWMGGGIYCNQSDVNIYNCLFNSNHADDGAGYGYCGGIYLYNSDDVTIHNCTLVNNDSGLGSTGGIYLYQSDAVTIINCIMWWNDSPAIIYYLGDEPTVTYSNIEGGWSGTGNIDTDPQFAEEIDFHLDASSLCVDAGDPSILDGSQPPGSGGTRSDMGAYGGSSNGYWLEGPYDLFLYPTGPTTVTVGDTVFFDALFWNSTDNSAPGDYWLSVVLPNSNEILLPNFVLNHPNPLHGSTSAHGTATISNELRTFFPGTFEVVARIGVYPDVIVDEESFAVEISP